MHWSIYDSIIIPRESLWCFVFFEGSLGWVLHFCHSLLGLFHVHSPRSVWRCSSYAHVQGCSKTYLQTQIHFQRLFRLLQMPSGLHSALFHLVLSVSDILLCFSWSQSFHLAWYKDCSFRFHSSLCFSLNFKCSQFLSRNCLGLYTAKCSE